MYMIIASLIYKYTFDEYNFDDNIFMQVQTFLKKIICTKNVEVSRRPPQLFRMFAKLLPSFYKIQRSLVLCQTATRIYMCKKHVSILQVKGPTCIGNMCFFNKTVGFCSLNTLNFNNKLQHYKKVKRKQ